MEFRPIPDMTRLRSNWAYRHHVAKYGSCTDMGAQAVNPRDGLLGVGWGGYSEERLCVQDIPAHTKAGQP